MAEETETRFVSWKKSAVGGKNVDITVNHLASGPKNDYTYNELRFNVKLEKENDFPAFKLAFVASMESPSGVYLGRHGKYSRPSLDHCSAQILLVGPNGIEIVKRFHIQMGGSDLSNSREHDFLPKTVVLSEYQDPYFFKKNELESSGIAAGTGKLRAFTVTVEIFGRMKMMTMKIVSPAPSERHEGNQLVAPKVDPRLFMTLFWDHSSSSNQSKKLNFKLDSSPTDIIFTFSGGLETVEAHSYVLAVQSQVFRKMLFEVNMKEKGDKMIPIMDTTPEIMRNFLKLVYNESTIDDLMGAPTCDIIKIFVLGHKYEVKDVIDSTMYFIMCSDNDRFTMEDIAEMIQLSRVYSISDFATRCCQWLRWKGSTAQGNEEVDTFIRDAEHWFVLDFSSFLVKMIAPMPVSVEVESPRQVVYQAGCDYDSDSY